MNSTGHEIRLAARPSGLPKPSDWELTEPVPGHGADEFVVEVSHLSIDPAMRGWMNAGASCIEPVEIGAVMRAGAVGTVSEHPGFAPGDSVYGAPEQIVAGGVRAFHETLLKLFADENIGKLVLAVQ